MALFFLFKQKTAYEMRISDWSSDVCSSDLAAQAEGLQGRLGGDGPQAMQMILVGGKAWSNQGNAGWAEVPEKFATTIAKQMKDTVVEPPKDESQDRKSVV